MQSWNDAILNLPDLSKRLGAEMCPQIVQFFSAFMHSCLEDKHITGWLRSFYDKTGESLRLLDCLIVFSSVAVISAKDYLI